MSWFKIEEAETYVEILDKSLKRRLGLLKTLVRECEERKNGLELLKTQIASARIDGKKEFDANTYMKGKKK